MVLYNSEIVIVIASAFILGYLSSLFINTNQLIQLLKKTISQEKQDKLTSKKAQETKTDLKKEKELVQSNQELVQKVKVLESEADGEDCIASPVSDDRYQLSEIDGIGKGYSTRLNDEGYTDTNDLAKINGDSEKIGVLSQAIGLEFSEVSGWCSMADLMRVNGIRGPFAFLLNRVGIESLGVLSECNAEKLAKQLALENMNESKTPTVPSPVTIKSWIGEAIKLVNT